MMEAEAEPEYLNKSKMSIFLLPRLRASAMRTQNKYFRACTIWMARCFLVIRMSSVSRIYLFVWKVQHLVPMYLTLSLLVEPM